MVLIGSRALHYWYKNYRPPRDWDVICTPEEFTDWVKKHRTDIESVVSSRGIEKFACKYKKFLIEFEIAHPGTSCELIRKYTIGISFFSEFLGTMVIPANPHILLAIKKSHLSVPLKKWDTHIEDYHFLKHFTTPHEVIYTLRKTETDARHKQPKINLNMTNSEFFDQSEGPVQRIFHHDDVHKAIMYYNVPMYEKIKKDSSLAKCDKDLFEHLSHVDQIRCVQEEAYVIALERKLLPTQQLSSDEAFKWALRRICTTLTSGWFRTFAQENYPEIVNTRCDFYGKFLKAVHTGLIQPKEDTSNVS